MARVSFRVIRINRWSLALALLLALGILLLPLGRLLTASSPESRRVKAGVTVLGRDLGRRTAGEARAVLEELARLAGIRPAGAPASGAAAGAPGTGYVVLDVDTTLFRVLTAPAGASVAPAWAPWPAAAIRQAAPEKQAVALIINVAWGTEYLPDMLNALKREQARATFLVTGKWAERNPELLRAIRQDGHEIGNHGWDANANPLDLLHKGQLRDDIQRADAAIQRVIGEKPKYYQPHMGALDRDGRIIQIARELGYTTVLWTPGQDTIDWQPGTTKARVLQRVADVKAGDLILMHPTEPSRQALPEILRLLASKGLRTLTLSQILAPGTPDKAS